jgi:hypothetical protein
MAAASHDILIEKGATFQLSLLWKDGAGSPITLVGYTARMQVRQKHDSIDPAALDLTTENGGITLGGAAGTINVIAAATATDDITFKRGVYDLELVSGAGIVTRLIEGFVTVTPEVTR